MAKTSDGGEGAGPGGAAGVRRDRSALDDLPAPAGLCATCLHLEVVGSKRSVFVRCGLSDADARFPRYPRLPVRRCAGWQRDPGAGEDADEADVP